MDFLIADTAVFGKRKWRDKEPSPFVHPEVAAALIGSAVVGGAMSASASKSAANSQVAAANHATDAQVGMFNQTVDMESPFRSMGQGAGSKLSNLLGINQQSQDNFDANAYLAANPDVAADPYYSTHPWEHYANHGKSENRPFTAVAGTGSAAPDFGSLDKPFSMSDFQLDPGIQFQTQQGNQALQNSQAAKNGTLSGGALKDLIAYNQGMAGTGYQSAFDRYMANKQFTLGSLMGMTNLGQAAAGNTVNSASGFSSGIAGSMMGAGNAAAAGTIGAGNALSGAASNAGNSYFLSSLLGKSGSASGSPAGGVVSDDSIANFA